MSTGGTPKADDSPEMIVAKRKRNVRLYYDGSRVQTIMLNGQKITITVEREEINGGRDKLPENWRQVMEKIVLKAESTAGRDAIVQQISDMVEAKKDRPGPPPLMIPDHWGGGWDRRSDIPPRTLDSVILKEGQLDRLVGDLANFFAAEKDYTRISRPWHRGYLFSGPPGTGKTSVAKALANHFGMPVYYLPLADLEKDSNLMSLVSAVNSRAMLLLEDADVYHAATQRDDEGRVTLSALLNALDGIWTPHGLVTVLTSNHADSLDPAMIRPGRVDVVEEFTNVDADQAARMFEWFYEDRLHEVPAERLVGLSPSTVIGAMGDNPKDPEAAWHNLKESVAAN